jgi:Ca-activated chloride channel family protein
MVKRIWSGWMAAAALAVLGMMIGLAPAGATPVRLDVRLGEPVIVAGQSTRSVIKISLRGDAPAGAKKQRPALNVALVIDKSGSMGGARIEQARRAALLALDRLNDDDILSVVAYDHTVSVLVPATKVSDRDAIRRRIQGLRASGNTALFAGVSKGAEEVRKFLSEERVNRIILLSDGLANVGPSSPGELGRLGASLARDGISVTTIGLGLGYNEDLMTQLAQQSDGNHSFVEEPAELARIFDAELGDVLGVVAQRVEVTIECAPGIRPIRILGRNASIADRRVVTALNQVYDGQEKYILLEVEIPAGEAGRSRDVAKVEVDYNDLSAARQQVAANARVRYSGSRAEVARGRDSAVLVAAATIVAAENSRRAVELRDEGKVEEARTLLQRNAATLATQAAEYNAPGLEAAAATNRADAEKIDDEAEWTRQRKDMRQEQYRAVNQQSY